MSNNVGVAHGGGPHLPPRGKPKQTAGLFSAQVGPTLPATDQDWCAEGLELGLLVRAPKPEGSDYVEVSAAGYERQSLSLTPDASNRRANAAPVSFGPISADWPPLSHVGIFDAEGVLVAYGAIVAMGRGAAEGVIEFGTFAIRMKQSPRAMTVSR